MRGAGVLVRIRLCFCSAARSRSTARSHSPADRPVFRAGIDVVRLDVRVTDDVGQADRRSAPGRSRGRRRRHAAAGRLVPAHRRRRPQTTTKRAQRTIASEISTNQGAPRGQLYVLVFDQDHITSGAEQRVRQAAETFLRRRFTPEDRVAIYGLPGPARLSRSRGNVSTAIAQLQLVRGGLQRTLHAGRARHDRQRSLRDPPRQRRRCSVAS